MRPPTPAGESTVSGVGSAPSSAGVGFWRTALGGNGAEEAMARLRESFCPEILTLDPEVMLEDLLDGAAVRGERAGRVDVELSIAEHEEAALRFERGQELRQQIIDDGLGDVLKDFDEEERVDRSRQRRQPLERLGVREELNRAVQILRRNVPKGVPSHIGGAIDGEHADLEAFGKSAAHPADPGTVVDHGITVANHAQVRQELDRAAGGALPAVVP